MLGPSIELGGQQASGAALRSRREERLKGVAFLGLLALIVISPLPLGSARPLAWDIMGLWTAALLALCARISMREVDALLPNLRVPFLLFGVIIVFAVVQILSITPSSWHNPLWSQAADTLQRSVPGSIAVDRSAVLVRLLRLLEYAGIFYLAVVLCRNPARAQIALKISAISGTFYAVYGLAVYWSGSNTILWMEKWAYGGDVTGPFVNRNSFATYLGLCLLSALGSLAISLEKVTLHSFWRRNLREILEITAARWWLLVCLFSLVVALCLSHSRAGLFCSLAGILALAVAASQANGIGGLRRLRFALIPVPLMLLAFLIAGSSTVDRMFGAGDLADDRFTVYALTVDAMKDYPILGTGLGSFATIFQLYRSEAVSAWFDLAHNDYLENLLELGIPVATCLFVSLGWLVALCILGVRSRRRDAIFPCVGVAASVLVALHESVDFSLQIPAVTATYMLLLGAAIAQSRSMRPRP